MHVVDLTGKTDQEIITIITSAGRTAEKWEAATKNLCLKASFRTNGKKHPKFERSMEEPKRSGRRQGRRDRSERSERKNKRDRSDRKEFKKGRSDRNQDYSKTERIDSSELG